VASGGSLCVYHGSGIKSFLDFVHDFVGVGSVCYDRVETDGYGVKEGIEEKIHVVIWLLAMELEERHVDELVIERSHATKDLCFGVTWLV
jgi:hypothetical protein